MVLIPADWTPIDVFIHRHSRRQRNTIIDIQRKQSSDFFAQHKNTKYRLLKADLHRDARSARLRNPAISVDGWPTPAAPFLVKEATSTSLRQTLEGPCERLNGVAGRFQIRSQHAISEAFCPPFPHFDPFGTEFREPGRVSHPTYFDSRLPGLNSRRNHRGLATTIGITKNLQACGVAPDVRAPALT